MAFDVSAVEDYVEENKFPLLQRAIFNAPSIELFNVQAGIEYKAKIHDLDVSVEFQDCDCGFNPAGEQIFSDREIEVGCIEIEDQLCMHDLRKKWANRFVRITAGQESMGILEQEIVDGVIADVAKKLEIALYQGDKASSDPNLNKFDGLLKIADASVPAGNKIVAAAGESYYQTLLNVVAAIPQDAIDRGGIEVLMGSAEYRALIAYFTAKTINYTTDPIGEGDSNGTRRMPWIYLPGTEIRVYGVRGLSGTRRIIAAAKDNLIYGTDLLNDWETLDWWFSKDADAFRYRIRFRAGTQIAFPDEVILGTFAADANNNGATPITVAGEVTVNNNGTFAGPTP